MKNSKIITIDTGTTNTRVTLWKNHQVAGKAFRETGVRDTAIDGSNRRLKAAIREAILEVLKEKNLSLEEIDHILASGMITSNVGLIEVPHLSAPAGMDELAAGMVKIELPDVVDKGIWFIPGIKNNVPQVTLDNCEAMDMMRGEETETIGLIERMGIRGPAVIVLPGSHSKFVSIDEQNKITGCLTSLAGELISVITNHTILANALEKSFATEINREYLLKGFEYSNRAGLNRTCFTLRILDQFTEIGVNEKANFLLGIVLADDLKALKNSHALAVRPDAQVIVAGMEILRNAFATILEADGTFRNIRVAPSEVLKDLAGYGAICIARRRGLLEFQAEIR